MNLYLSSIDIWLVLLVCGLACSVIGSILIVNRMALIADAMSHSVLLGIVIVYLILGQVNNFIMLLGASLFGLLSIFFIEKLSDTKNLTKADTSGIIYPLFFSIAVILINIFAKNVHIDTDMIIMGEVVFSSLDTINLFGIKIARSFFSNAFSLSLNLIYVIVFNRQIKLTAFDKEQAKLFGVNVKWIMTMLLFLTAFTSVSAFNSVGAILVISMLIVPSATALLFSKELNKMMVSSGVITVFNVTMGYILAIMFNVSISAMVASINGIVFLLVLIYLRRNFKWQSQKIK